MTDNRKAGQEMEKDKRYIAALFIAWIMALLYILFATKEAEAETMPIEAAGKPEQIIEPVAAIQEDVAIEQKAEGITEAAYNPSIEAEDGYISEAELMAICDAVGGMYDICPELLQAIAERESTLYINAENQGCYGLMQISTRWHTERMERLGVSDIYEPYGNILVAADYLAELFNINQDVSYVLMRYNMAADTAERLYSEGHITDYAIEITERAAELEKLHGK